MRVLVVTSEWPSDEHPESGTFVVGQVEALRATGVDIDVESFRGAKDPRRYVAARRRIRGVLARGRYDLVHAHFGQSGFTVIPAPVPLLVTFHGSDLRGLVSRRGTYTAAGFVLTRVSRLVARFADEVIVQSESLARRLPRGVRYSVVPMAVDLAVFRPGDRAAARRALGLDAARRYVLFAGRRDAPVKRFDLAQRAIETLRAAHDIELLTIRGLPPEGVATHMQASDALLVTSRHEGGPAMVKEALACGLPVVTVDVGDVRETLSGLDGSRIVADDSPESIGRSLDAVLRAPRPAPADVGRFELSAQARRVGAIYERLATAR
jgi:glycosyltransferase involved in cell wall biosynthesis